MIFELYVGRAKAHQKSYVVGNATGLRFFHKSDRIAIYTIFTKSFCHFLSIWLLSVIVLTLANNHNLRIPIGMKILQDIKNTTIFSLQTLHL